MDADFTLAGYRTLLLDFASLGYTATTYETVSADRPHLILRHDIDMSMAAALEIAQIETAQGLSAHYFVLLRSELYNPWSPDNRKALRRLRALGHRVGLHFDASLYPDTDDDLESACASECAILASLLEEEPAPIVSFHRPAPRLQGAARRFAGLRHTYEPAFFSEIGYCSDSRGEWRHGYPLSHPAVAAGRALQLLTHPVWWTRQHDESARSRLDRLRHDRDREFARELAANCDIYTVPAETL